VQFDGLHCYIRNLYPTRVGLLDEEFATAMDGGDGGDDLQRLDLRSPASARYPDQRWLTPLMLRAIAAAKKKNDQIAASKI
jgi:hypothetical protein